MKFAGLTSSSAALVLLGVWWSSVAAARPAGDEVAIPLVAARQSPGKSPFCLVKVERTSGPLAGTTLSEPCAGSCIGGFCSPNTKKYAQGKCFHCVGNGLNCTPNENCRA